MSGEEAYKAASGPSGPRERHRRQLRAHLQARGVQDQEDRGLGPFKDSLGERQSTNSTPKTTSSSSCAAETEKYSIYPTSNISDFQFKF